MKRKPSTSAASKSTAKKIPQPIKRPTKPASSKAPQPQALISPDSTQSKQAQLIALLNSATGASMAQMMGLTQWQPHTVRGMLSGSLRKRLGLNVQWQVEDGVRVYRIVEEGCQ